MSSITSSLIAFEALNVEDIDEPIKCERAKIEEPSILADLPIEILSHIITFSSVQSSVQDVKNLSLTCRCIYILLAEQRKKLKQFNAEIKPHFPDLIVNVFNHWTDLLDLKKVKFEKSWRHKFSVDDFKDPITIAIDKMNERFIAIKFIEKKLDGSLKDVRLFFLEKIDTNMFKGKYKKIFSNDIHHPIRFHSTSPSGGGIISMIDLTNKHDEHFNFVKRLVNGENVGVLIFPNEWPNLFECHENDIKTITDGSSAAEIIKV